MIWFQLWREFKLSIAEILAVFPNWKIVYFDSKILILDNINKDEILKYANRLWWTIKVLEIEEIQNPSPSTTFQGLPLTSKEEIIWKIIFEKAEYCEWKFKYWLSMFWNENALKQTLLKIKKSLKAVKISSRFINKDFKNLSSAQIIWEKLVNRWTDFTIISPLLTKEGARGWSDAKWFWTTIWVQDINSYSKRDYSKERDMQVGMLPPKLSQMMINICRPPLTPPSQGGGKLQVIYDPFVWLGTILIESLYMWNTKVFWSDLNEKMVSTSLANINELKDKSEINLSEVKIIKLNAKFIEESEVLKSWDVGSIVTEWYLWEIMTKANISFERIKKQRESLSKIYEAFFAWLKRINYSWTIVISFPFWEIKWKYFYFDEIYEILSKYCNIEELLPEDINLKTTKSWSLLYKRPSQLVWREIFKLTIK